MAVCATGKAMSESLFSCLFIESDIPAYIFSFLPSSADLCSVELVCQEWRTVVVEHQLWQQWLTKLYNTDISWKNTLTQHSWTDFNLDHNRCKQLCWRIATDLGPLGNELRHRFLDEDCTKASVEAIQRTVKCSFSEEYAFTSGFYDRRKEVFDMVEACRDATFDNDYGFSPLILTGPTAFPIVVRQRTGDFDTVLVAGATFGKGRVVVMGHEGLCCGNNPVLNNMIRHFADWCGGGENSSIAEDPLSKKWFAYGWDYNRIQVAWPRFACPRFMLLSDETSNDVFITHAHYDDHFEDVIEYVRQGGGLIIGGHAWWWKSQEQNDPNPLLQHPGNRITAPMGIVFSTECVSSGNLKISTGTVPGLRHSLYHAVKWGSSGHLLPLRWQVEDFRKWFNEVKDVPAFQDISKCLEYYINNTLWL